MNKDHSKNYNSTIQEEFLNRYNHEFDFYTAVSLLAAQLIEAQLVTKGIRAIVTSRAKNPDRLREKIAKRAIEESKQYKTSEDIYKDIVDLAGVRIALYFNSESDEIEQIINNIFDVTQTKTFPTEGKSEGYKAIHYRGKLKNSVLAEQQQRYSDANIEIQVASLLMHAWAEVEHDIVYKPLQGEVSKEEQNALDKLNDIVLQGEKMLENLQQATYKRNALHDQYELSDFLVQYFAEKDHVGKDKLFMGDMKKLYDYLHDTNIDTKQKVKNRINKFIIIIDEKWTLADQIMDHIQANYSPSRQSYLDNIFSIKRREKSSAASAAGFFLLQWIQLEKMLKSENIGSFYKDSFVKLRNLIADGILSEEQYDKISEMRIIRNNLVHGIEIPDNECLSLKTKEIEKLIKKLNAKIDENKNVS